MKRVAPLLALVAVLAAVMPARGANVFQDLAGFSAKETCSCVFVAGQTDDYCRAFGQIQGYKVDVAIDHGANLVTATYSPTVVRTARFVDGAGCTLDPIQ